MTEDVSEISPEDTDRTNDGYLFTTTSLMCGLQEAGTTVVHNMSAQLHNKQCLTGSGSTYRMRKCRAIDRQMAPTSQGLDQGGILSRDWFSDKLDSTKKTAHSSHNCVTTGTQSMTGYSV